MASEDPVQTPPAAPKKVRQERFIIHSLVRAIETRNQRMVSASRHRFVQRFGGGKITVRRARPATINKSQLMQYLKEIQQAANEGKVVVKTIMGQVVDLNTLMPVEAAPVSKPLPNPPLDSAATDKTFEHGVGQKMELFEGGGVPGGEAPPLNVKPPLMSSDEKPIQTSGDPARARAEAASATGGEQAPAEDGLEEDLGEDDPTKPDALGDLDETAAGTKRGKDKKSKKEGGK